MKNFLKNSLLQIALFGVVYFIVFAVMGSFFLDLGDISAIPPIFWVSAPLGFLFYTFFLCKQKLKIYHLILPDILFFFLPFIIPNKIVEDDILNTAIEEGGNTAGLIFICIFLAQILAIIVYLAVKLIVKIRKAKTKIKEK